MGSFGIWHWLIVIILVMLLFGKGRVSDMMGDLGKGLKSFKQGMADEDDKPGQPRSAAEPRQLPPQQPVPSQPYHQPPIDITPHPLPRMGVEPTVQQPSPMQGEQGMPPHSDPRETDPTPPPPPRDDTSR